MSTQRGQTLIAMYMVVVMLSVLGGSFLTKGFAVNQHSRIQKIDTEAFYLAQGGLEDATASFTSAIAGFQISSNPTCYPDTDGDGLCTPDIATQRDVMVTSFCTQSAACPACACPTSPFPAGSTAQAYSWIVAAEPTERTVTEVDGTVVRLRNYEIITRATHPVSPSYSATLHQVITRRLVSTFQHAVFYNDDLEVLPGANMTLTGRVHSNGNMYLDANGSSTLLTLNTDYVRTPGNIYNYRKQTGTAYNGDVTIKKYNTSPPQFQELLPGQDSTNASWATLSQTNWLGTVKTGVHGVTAMAVPSVASTQPSGANAYYANNADVKITNGLITKKNGAGYLSVIECAPATVNAGNQATCVPPGTLTTNTTDPADPNRYVNQRESNKIIKMTNIDVKQLGGYYNGDPPGSPGNPYISNLPSNGLLYATRDDAAPTEEPGIRLRNGSLINRAGGLTIVSNDPVYIQGDYNNPPVGTGTKKPVSVIADALHLLSNNWQDSNSYLGIGSRTVLLDTTFNAAFIAGIKTTTSANYNGGLENYPRLQENWSGRNLYITGSFVELWNSQIATGNWPGTGSVYNPPIRTWTYDLSFESGALPPFTPFAIEAIRGAWWKE